MPLPRLFSRRWVLVTLLVFAGTAVLARLGVWQLDRLEQRRAFNARVLAQIDQPALELDAAADALDLYNMEYRQVTVSGEYDFSQEVALRNQVYRDQYGVRLLTPLKISGSDLYVLVDRGWIPGDDFTAGLDSGAGWPQFQEPGVVTVRGVIRRPQTRPDFGNISDPTPAPGERIAAWHLANLPQMQAQMPYPILPVYIQQAPDEAWTSLPYRTQPELEISEGPHQGYAVQWFTFAAILFFGYPFFVYREDHRPPQPAALPGD